MQCSDRPPPGVDDEDRNAIRRGHGKQNIGLPGRMSVAGVDQARDLAVTALAPVGSVHPHVASVQLTSVNDAGHAQRAAYFLPVDPHRDLGGTGAEEPEVEGSIRAPAKRRPLDEPRERIGPPTMDDRPGPFGRGFADPHGVGKARTRMGHGG